MDMQHLYYLLELDKCRSINRASECLYISSQQLSRILRSIEEEYQIKIFERTNLGLQPTVQGQKFLQEIKVIANKNDYLKKIAYEVNDEEVISGTLTIYTTAIIWNRDKNCISRFANKYPKVKIEQYIKSPAKLLRDVANVPNSLGLYISLQKHETSSEEYNYLTLSKQKLCIYCSNNHSLAKRMKGISLAEIKDVPLILYKPYAEDDHILRRIFELSGKVPNIKYVVSDKDLFFALLNDNDCIHIGSYFAKNLRDKNLCVIPLSENIEQHFELVTHINSQDSPLVRAFSKVCIEYYKNL